jgi:hypothetical protein
MNCDKIYRSIIDGSDSSNYTLFDLAQCFMSGFDPKYMIYMLESDDTGIVLDGLFVVNEIGDQAKDFLPQIHNLLDHFDCDVRNRAREIYAIAVQRP